MVRQRSSEVRELGRYWRFKETAKGCRRFWQRYLEAPEKRETPGEIWSRWRQPPKKGIKEDPQRTCGKLRKLGGVERVLKERPPKDLRGCPEEWRCQNPWL